MPSPSVLRHVSAPTQSSDEAMTSRLPPPMASRGRDMSTAPSASGPKLHAAKNPARRVGALTPMSKISLYLSSSARRFTSLRPRPFAR